MKKPYLAVICCTVSMLLFGSASVVAQTAPTTAATAQPGAELDEVIVTARRRDETLQNVPAAVQVLSAATLVEQGIRDETDLQLSVPGLIVKTNTSQEINYSIRGETLDAFSGSAPGVQAYINEVPIVSQTPSTFFDLDSVQVLKGPQGTLFGRNTTGGAVLFTTARPTNDFGGYASVQYGNFGMLQTDSAINLPIQPDKLLLRIASTYQQGGAFVKNLYSGETVGNRDGEAFRVTLEFKPIDEITNITTAQYDHIYGTQAPSTILTLIPCNGIPGTPPNTPGPTCFFQPSNPNFQKLIGNGPGPSWYNDGTGYPHAGYIYPGGYNQGFANYVRSFGAYTVDQNNSFLTGSVKDFIGNTTTYDISPTLAIKNIVGYMYSYLMENDDNDQSPYPLLGTGGNAPGGSNNETQIDDTVSEELQLQGKTLDSRLSYIIGGFYNREMDHLNSPITGSAIFGNDLGDYYTFALRYNQIARDTTYAIFFQGTYAFTDKLNFTGGFRETWAQLTADQGPGSAEYLEEGTQPGGPGTPICCAFNQRTNEQKPSWTVSTDYHFTSDLMAYVTTRGSWRVGGYDPVASPVSNTWPTAQGGNFFLPQTTKDVEIGAKFDGHIGEMPLQLNVDLFHSWDWNAQKAIDVVINGIISSGTVNVPTSQVQGVEFDFAARPTSWLKIGGTFSYNNAAFIQNHVYAFGSSSYFDPYADVPRFSGTLYADVTGHLPGDSGILRYHVDTYAESEFNISNLGDSYNPGSEIPAYTLVNMRLDWLNPENLKGLTASLFVRNLANRLYYTGGAGGALETGVENVTYGMPRTYGAILRYEF